MVKITLLTCLLITLPWTMHASAPTASVPPEIKEYVTASNFVAAFSTPQERLALARYDAPEDVKRDTGSERLKAIFLRAHQLMKLDIQVDPDMNLPMHRERVLMSPPGWLQIESVRSVGDSRILIEMLVYRLDREAVAQFIASHEENETPPEIETAFRTAPHRMVQEWVRINGSWRKKEAHLHYLDR
jgi:hypothetical protein